MGVWAERGGVLLNYLCESFPDEMTWSGGQREALITECL